jgi:adenylate cyclase
MTETRKLAAILAADVVGYSRLAGADEVSFVSRPSEMLGDDGWFVALYERVEP